MYPVSFFGRIHIDRILGSARLVSGVVQVLCNTLKKANYLSASGWDPSVSAMGERVGLPMSRRNVPTGLERQSHRP